MRVTILPGLLEIIHSSQLKYRKLTDMTDIEQPYSTHELQLLFVHRLAWSYLLVRTCRRSAFLTMQCSHADAYEV